MLRYTQISMLTIVLIVSLAGSAEGACPTGDLNGDCRVDLDDLEILAEQWLAPPQSPGDLNSDDEVGVVDFGLLASNWRQSGISLVINEFAASNSYYVQDPQGEYDDWIEIYNVGHEAIDVSGMYPVIDAVTFGPQSCDMSYGSFPDATDNWRFMAFPTPGGENIAVYLGLLAEPKSATGEAFIPTHLPSTSCNNTYRRARRARRESVPSIFFDSPFSAFSAVKLASRQMSI